MYLPDPGWLRPLLAFALAVVGVLLRFVLPSRPGVRGFRNKPDEDIALRVRDRTGEILLLWAAWVCWQMATDMPESWVTTVWAPLVITAALVPSYSARLYARRYLAMAEKHPPDPEETPIPARGGWTLVVTREVIPLMAVLIPILVVRQHYPEIPDQVPVGWDLSAGNFLTRARDDALEILRHRTMVVYIVLFGLEGIYLLVTWAMGRREDIAARMLTPRHWLFFLFKVGWVVTFAGLNLGLVYTALAGGSPILFVLPGMFALAALGTVVAFRARREPTGE